MGNNPRRVYIYPPQEQDDGDATNFWPPGPPQSSDDQLPSSSSDYPEGYLGQGGGLLGMLLRGMQQDRNQPEVDSRLASNGTPEVDFSGYSNPQGGVLGRLAALQPQQSPSQQSMGSTGLALSDPRNPNFRQLSRVPVAAWSQREISSDRAASDLGRSNGAPSQAPVANTSAPEIKLASRHSIFPVSQSSPALADGIAAMADVGPRNPTQAAPQASGGVLGTHSGQSMPSNATAPTIKMAQRVLPGIPFPLPGPPTPIPMPAIPDWLKAAGPILRGVFSHLRIGGYDNYSRCMRAAAGDTDQWEDFCRHLGAGMSNTSGGETQNRACWSKTFESKNNKEQWCRNQFGGD
jgi:hypothetical protein